MKLKPVKFIGHKLGPFEHIELNWEKDSRYTLIVAENGMGKTTLVAAMAACLSFGNETLFPTAHFERFAHDKTSFAYLELELGGEIGWIFRWASQAYKGVQPVYPEPNSAPDMDTYHVLSLQDWEIVETPLRPKPTNLPDWLALKDAIFIDNTFLEGRIQVACSSNLLDFLETWYEIPAFKMLVAAYGVSRDIQQPEKIREQQDLDGKALKGILNPFAPIQSTEIFQWIANQYIYHALALSENKPDEAQAYLAAIQRLEQLLGQDLEYPISFQVKRNPFRLEVKQDGTTLSVDQLSDGTRSFLSWPLDYLMRASRINWANPADSATAPGLILVDEIDCHLHPEWQRRVMPAASQLLPETYIIATTHSPFVLGATDEAQIFQIYKDENGQLSAKASFDELYGYPADLVLEKAFVPSLYAPEVEQKLLHLSELAGKVTTGEASPQEKQEHDELLEELARVNSWLNSLLALSQGTKEPSA